MVHITAEKLETTLQEVEKFCTWLEAAIDSRLRSK